MLIILLVLKNQGPHSLPEYVKKPHFKSVIC